MQEIRKKKNKIIDLRKKKIALVKAVAVKIPIMEAIETPTPPQPFQGGAFPCVDCRDLSAQEFGRCQECDTKHRQLVTQMDARPKMPEPVKIEPKLTYRKEVIGGVVVTISTSEPLRL